MEFVLFIYFLGRNNRANEILFGSRKGEMGGREGTNTLLYSIISMFYLFFCFCLVKNLALG